MFQKSSQKFKNNDEISLKLRKESSIINTIATRLPKTNLTSISSIIYKKFLHFLLKQKTFFSFLFSSICHHLLPKNYQHKKIISKKTENAQQRRRKIVHSNLNKQHTTDIMRPLTTKNILNKNYIFSIFIVADVKRKIQGENNMKGNKFWWEILISFSPCLAILQQFEASTIKTHQFIIIIVCNFRLKLFPIMLLSPWKKLVKIIRFEICVTRSIVEWTKKDALKSHRPCEKAYCLLDVSSRFFGNYRIEHKLTDQISSSLLQFNWFPQFPSY